MGLEWNTNQDDMRNKLFDLYNRIGDVATNTRPDNLLTAGVRGLGGLITGKNTGLRPNPDGTKHTGDEQFFAGSAASAAPMANPAYDKIMSAPDPRRDAIIQMRGIQSQPDPSGSTSPQSDPWTPYSGPSGESMAQSQYKDQYALLDKMGKDSTQAYANAGNEMGGIYERLSKAMSGESVGIQNRYNETGTAIGNRYNSAVEESNAGYDKSRNFLSQMAKNLGIEQGLPNAERIGYDQQNFLSGLMRANQANDVNSNSRMGNNEVSFNNRNAQVENNMGASSRADFKNRGLAALQGINDKRLSVKSNQAQSANDYAMKIAQMNSDSKSAWNTDQTNKAQQVVAAGRLKLDNETAAAKAASDANRPADTSKMNAYQRLANDANTAYSGNERDAQRAMKIIQDMWDGGWGGDKNWDSASDFYNDVARSNPPAKSSQLSQLANMFYANMVGGAGKKFVGGTNGARTDWNG